MKKTLLISLCFFAFGLVANAQYTDTDAPPQKKQRTVKRTKQQQVSNDQLTVTEINHNQPQEEELPHKNTRFTIGGGYSYWLGKSIKTGDSQLDNFSSGLRHGFNIDIDGQFFLSEYMGIGLNVYFIQQSNSANNLYIPGYGTASNYKETNHIIYAGPTWALRYKKNNWGLYANLGIGPLFYTNTTKISSMTRDFSKTAFGTYESISAEYKCSPQTAIGLKLSISSASIDVENMEDKLSLSNFMITAFISFGSR